MNILLVIPPAPFLIDDKSLPFLGILSIATVLKNNNKNVHVLDLLGIKNYVEVLDNHIKANNYDIIGFTINTPQLPYVINMLEVIPPHIKKIAGGPQHYVLLFCIETCSEHQNYKKHKRFRRQI